MSESDVTSRSDPGLVMDYSPLYRLPRSIVYLVPGGAPAVGAAYGAYQEYKSQMARYTSRRDGASRASDRVVQLRLAEAHSAVSQTQAQILADCDEMMGTVRTGSMLPPADAARYAWHITNAADACVSAVRGIFQTLGASVVYSSNPLQRYYRDVLTMRQHGTQDRDRNFTGFSQIELGVQP